MNSTIAAGADLQLTPPHSLQLDASIGPLALALMEILALRRTERVFSGAPLARLLWAAHGCNRRAGPLRTVPAPPGACATGLYVALADGLYLFSAAGMRLARLSGEDMRPTTGRHGC